MIHVDSVTAALQTQLNADAVLVSSAFSIEEGEAFNHDPNLTPWVGIYHGALRIDPHTLGGTQPWEGQLELFVYVQEHSLRSGQDATRRLSQAQAAVLAAVNADRTLGGAALMVTAMDIAPFQRDLAEDTWLFTNEIALKLAVRG